MADTIVPPTIPTENTGDNPENPENQSGGPKAPAVIVKPSDTFVKKLKRIATSTLLLIIAFIIVHTFMQLLMGGLANVLGYKVSVSFNHLRLQPRDYRHWSRARIALVFVLPPMFCLFLGFMSLNFLRVNTQWIKSNRLLVFWLMICLANICLSHLFFSPLGITEHDDGDDIMIFYQTFAVFGSWMRFTSTIMGAFAALAVIISVLFGVISRDEILRYSPSSRASSKPWGKHFLVLQLYVIPVILSFYPLIQLSDKNNVIPSMFIWINLLIISIGMFIRNSNDNKSLRPDKSDVLNHIPLIEMGVVFVLWIGIYFFFR